MTARMFPAMVAALVLAACGTESAPAQETPHGYVEGATETAEAQPRLVVADGETGAVRVLDLITEEVVEVGRVDGIAGIHGDGRFAYLVAGRSVQVVDSGAWMVDHGDHAHYYRAEVRKIGTVGTISGEAATSVHSDPSVAAVSFADGRVVLLDRAELEQGTVAKIGTIERDGRHTTAVPYREHLLVSGTGVVEVRTRTGKPVAVVDEPCPDPRDTAVTRRGVVFGCADGALLVTEQDGTFTGARIAYPATEAGLAREFRQRRMSATLVAGAGEHGVWTLDVSKASWTMVPTGPVVAANTAGEGAPLLTLTRDGVLHALDAKTGTETARRKLIAEPLAATPPVIEVDPTRAYVNDAAAGTVYEIDYNDDLRVARTFTLDIKPTHLVETGR